MMHDDEVLQAVTLELQRHKQLKVRYKTARHETALPTIHVSRPGRLGTVCIIRAGANLQLMVAVKGHYINLQSVDLSHPDSLTHLWDVIRLGLKKRYVGIR